MRKFTGARPVRFDHGWIECEPHRAQRWQPVLADRILSPAPYSRNRREAMQLVTTNVLRHAPLPRNYKFGKRMEQAPNLSGLACAVDKAKEFGLDKIANRFNREKIK